VSTTRPSSASQYRQPDVRRAFRGERPVLLDDLVERSGPDQLHHDPRPALGPHDVVHRDHVRVIEASGGARLAQGALEHLVALGVGELQRQDDFLDRHVTVQHLVAGEPDPAHPACTYLARQPVSVRDELLRIGHGPPDSHPISTIVHAGPLPHPTFWWLIRLGIQTTLVREKMAGWMSIPNRTWWRSSRH
jgi:hypothetical protein